MAAFLNNCRFYPTGAGTGDWTYAAFVNGYRGPAAANAVNGRVYKFRAENYDALGNISQWEMAEGTYNSSSATFARTTILSNSAGTLAKISFTSIPQVAVVALKEDLLSIEEANTFTAAQKQQARLNLGLGSASLMSGLILVARTGQPAAATADYVCDGTSDEVEINAAITAAAAAGCAVLVLGGSFSIGSAIEMASNVAFYCDPTTQFIAAVAMAEGGINCRGITNFVIDGAGIDLRTNNVSGNGIVCAPVALFSAPSNLSGTPCSNYVIRNCRIKVQKGHAYHIWNVRSTDFTVDDNFIDGGYTSADTFTSALSQEGIECVGTKRFSIINNEITGVGNAAINLPSFADLSTDIAFKDGIIANNIGKTCGSGVLVTVYSDPISGELGGIKNVDIKNNSFSELYVNGFNLVVPSISGSAFVVPIYDLSVEGNKFIGADTGQPTSSVAFTLNNQKTLADIDVRSLRARGNTFANWLPTASGSLIGAVSFKGFDFSDNTVRSPAQGSGTGYGVAFFECTDFKFDRNAVTGGRVYGVSLQGCTDWSVCNNTIKDWNGGNSGAPAIIVQTSATPIASTKGRLQGNRFSATNFASVGNLISIDATAAEIDYLAPDNAYIGSSYTGGIVTNASSNIFNRGVSAFSKIRTLVITSTGSYVPSKGMRYCKIRGVGGGAGGGAAVGTSGQSYTGGGGGAGGYAERVATAADIGASQTVTIGAAGAGGVAGSNNGTAGGDTSVGALLIAKGGSPGTFGSAANVGAGGLGGVAGTGDFTSPGAPGFAGQYNSTAISPIIPAGAGGSSPFGGGGRAVAAVAAAAGNNATGYGSGGGGAFAHNTASSFKGGDGTAGVVIIEEYGSLP